MVSLVNLNIIQQNQSLLNHFLAAHHDKGDVLEVLLVFEGDDERLLLAIVFHERELEGSDKVASAMIA